MNRTRTVLLGSLLVIIGCGGDEARLREEARRFVDLYAKVEYDAPPEARAAVLGQLDSAVFVAEEVVQARSVCLAGHRQLIEAQRVQDETAAEIDRALTQTQGAQPLPEGALAALQKKLESGQATLGQARQKLEDCEARARALDLRFGKR